MTKRKFGLFEVSVILFFYVLPVLCILLENILIKNTSFFESSLKWFVFWGVGLRFFTCGIKQSLSPKFTANEIFELYDEKGYPIVRELGFANICSGLCGIISLFNINFRVPAAFIGIVYFGLALLQHIFRKNKNSTEVFVTITDLSIVLFILISFILK